MTVMNKRDGTHPAEVEIGLLTPDEVGDAMGVLARGMRDNPNHVAAFGHDPGLRLLRLGNFFERLKSIEEWQALVARDAGRRIVGVMAVTRPGECGPSSPRKVRSLSSFYAEDPDAAPLVARWVEAWRDRDPDERHWHLGPFAVEARLQERGIGSDLLRVFCAQMDAGRENAYLETDMRRNVGFFRRFGFEVIAEHPVLGATNWFMIRRPDSGADLSGARRDAGVHAARSVVGYSSAAAAGDGRRDEKGTEKGEASA